MIEAAWCNGQRWQVVHHLGWVVLLQVKGTLAPPFQWQHTTGALTQRFSESTTH